MEKQLLMRERLCNTNMEMTKMQTGQSGSVEESDRRADEMISLVKNDKQDAGGQVIMTSPFSLFTSLYFSPSNFNRCITNAQVHRWLVVPSIQ